MSPLASMCPAARRRGRTAPAFVAALIGLLALSGCGGDAGATDAVASVSSPASAPLYRGDVLPQPVSLTPSAATATFQSTAGGTTTLGDLQSGHLMLVYFGYTHCPDVCPTTLADIGIALRQLPTSLQQRVQVVFLTSDPDRDSVAVMSSWLAHFDSGLPTPFIGLTTGLQQIDSVAASMGVPLSPPQAGANGSVTVEHGAQTLAFRDRRATVVWLASTTPDDYAHDLAELAAA